jgi:predicted TIM-barrel fold metal-dependent hydrolase
MENGVISLEEHFFSKASASTTAPKYSQQLKHIPGLLEKLHDLGPLRLKHMDAGRISIQVVSHGPGSMTPAQCCSANDELAAAVRTRPDRLAGLAVLPTADPDAAAAELHRCIKGLGFVGALVDNHANGKYYDGPEYQKTLWLAAQELDVPIYLHPTWPTEPVAEALYQGSFSEGASLSLGASGFGWHSDVGLHVLRLFASGLFDQLPRLKIVIGHMGEMLPFMLDRVVQLSPRWGPRQRDFETVWDGNIWITTSGVWSVDPMACIVRNTKIDHILYSVDYPFAKNEDGLLFLEELRRSGLVTEEELRMIVYTNAKNLLKLKHAK